MKYVLMKAPLCAADITDGSERAEYVPQKYILEVTGRPHRAINLMYEYHPHDKNWPQMGRLINKHYRRDRRTNGYFPYMALDKGHTNCEPFNHMRDIRKFGQDVQLTMTFDLNVSDEKLIKIAQDLNTFGYLEFRINHECNGHWFTFNKENSYKQVSDFFVRFHNILHQYAPNVKTNACFNGVGKDKGAEEHMKEDELAPLFRCADILSFDMYHSLHWGWPHDGYDPVRLGAKGKIKKVEKAYQISYDEWWDVLYRFVDLMLKVNNGVQKDIYLGEANTDADVVGLEEQGGWVDEIYSQIKKRNHPWLKGITYYQFRDRGGLGLEYELDEDKTKSRANPALDTYKKVIVDEYFNLQLEIQKEEVNEAELEWKSAREAKGVYLEKSIPSSINKCYLKINSDINAIIKINERWFHKSPADKKINISPALNRRDKIKIAIFSPPSKGENVTDKHNPDYLNNYKSRLKETQITLI